MSVPLTRSARRGALTAAAVALSLTAAACSSSDSGSSSGPSSSSSGSGTSAFQPQHQGGTLKLVAHAAAGTLDPQVNYTLQYWQLYQSMYDGLLAFKKVGGQQSFTVVPDLATSMPKVTNNGRTYTFTLRKGISFSNGKAVTTDDVVASFQRIFKVSSPTAGTFYNGIVGADACLEKPASCTLDKGVVGDAKSNTVTINLTAADPEFPYKLAVPHAVVVPKDSPTKDSGTKPLPTTGPYMAASYDPNRALKLVRNPHFSQWSREAEPQGYPDVIDYTFGQTVESEVTAVQNGQADWMYDPPPADRLNEIGTKYASQAHVNPLTAFWYATLNVNMAPFDNKLARQAINYAVDRSAVVRLYGGKNLASPACTILPPGFPGHVDSCDYTKGGGTTWKAADLAKAKALVKKSGTAGQEVGIVVQDDDVNKSIGQYLQSLLTQLGYKATLKPLSANIQFTYIQNTKNKVQLALTSWYQDYPAASDFLNVLLSCASYHPGSDSSINISGFCDKGIDARMQTALKTAQTDPQGADKQWGAIDQAVMAESPVVPLINPKIVDFTSSRVGNYQFSKQFYMLVGQLWVK
ncbi:MULTISPECIES: ABC transporter substrate-binding protein [unclassified Streptomyces]|uniref:ABC transporter substrate-binding protein n=1 Tax=unclassified Streptomyces TaxID=2593676 RepID=UPI00225717C1|nr:MULTISPECIES: ABC transporter substrate-binding protein [unclassified Streptomyces]MCX5337348.1 ABC transporter substrate-binding protein [Streptomyces sp. NBC_00140]MCX5365701.1 ABC transporter substrate-binding protein [Streptomyces sp. NBC_00124]